MGVGEPLGSIMAFEQLKEIVREHYAEKHPRELADMTLVVFLVKLDFLHCNNL